MPGCNEFQPVRHWGFLTSKYQIEKLHPRNWKKLLIDQEPTKTKTPAIIHVQLIKINLRNLINFFSPCLKYVKGLCRNIVKT